MSSAQQSTPVHREPASAMDDVSKEPVTRPTANKYFFTMFFLSVSVLIFVTITTVTGQWVKVDGVSNNNNVYQLDLWESCTCYDADTMLGCNKQMRLFRTAAGFSIIALGCQFFAIVAFSLIFANIGLKSTGVKRITGIVFSWLAVIALIISWAVFAGLFNERNCGIRYKDFGKLNWGFSLRIVETAFWIVVSVLFTMVNGRSEETRRGFLRAALISATFVFAVTVATTAGRGWIVGGPATGSVVRTEVSVFEACQCIRSKDFKCAEERRLFRNQQAFAIISVFLQVLLVIFVVFELPRFLHVITSFLVFAAIIITWATFGGWFTKSHCSQPKPDTVFQLFWPFGLNVVASFVEIVIFIISIVGACGHF
jgi:hypothetical protein